MNRGGRLRRFLQMLMLGLAVIYAIAAPIEPARADAAAVKQCAAMLPFGAPSAWNYSDLVEGYFTVCHAGYIASFTAPFMVPRWVAYRLTSDQVATCVPQKRPGPWRDSSGQPHFPKPEDAFRSDESMPAEMRSTPADYTSNQDKYASYEPLQLVPAEDFPFDPAAISDSFILSNTVPQVGEMMTYTWNFLEATIRSWARERGELIVYTGPVIAPWGRVIAPHMPLPVAMWKVVVDLQRHEAVAFIIQDIWMFIPSHIQYGDLGYLQTSIDEVERWSHVDLALPTGIDKQAKPPLWPSDVGRGLGDGKHRAPNRCLENVRVGK